MPLDALLDLFLGADREARHAASKSAWHQQPSLANLAGYNPAGKRARQDARRARNAAASVPSSSASNAPPIGTPCPTFVTVTPRGRSRSVNQCAVVAPSTVAPNARIISDTEPSAIRVINVETFKSSGRTPPTADSVPPST